MITLTHLDENRTVFRETNVLKIRTLSQECHVTIRIEIEDENSKIMAIVFPKFVNILLVIVLFFVNERSNEQKQKHQKFTR